MRSESLNRSRRSNRSPTSLRLSGLCGLECVLGISGCEFDLSLLDLMSCVVFFSDHLAGARQIQSKPTQACLESEHPYRSVDESFSAAFGQPVQREPHAFTQRRCVAATLLFRVAL